MTKQSTQGTPPEPKCQCGHSEGFHRKSLPRPCKLKCPCLGFELLAAPSVSTDHTDDEMRKKIQRDIASRFESEDPAWYSDGSGDYLASIAADIAVQYVRAELKRRG